jgi:hypothetical protein
VADAECDQLDSVRIGRSGVAEMDQGRAVIFLPRSDILRIELVFGSGAERPFIVAALGLVFAAVAVGSVVTAVLALLRCGARIPVALFSGVAFFVPAWWLINLGVRKQWYLRVHTRKGSRKLLFQTLSNELEIRKFVETARNRFGYSELSL